MVEGVAQLRKGLHLLPGVTDNAVRQEQELDLQIALGHGQLATQGYSAPEPGTAFARARELCEQVNRSAQLGSVLRGQFVYYLVRGELEQAQNLADELRHLGDAKNEVMWKCFGLMYQGNVSCWLGKFTEARAYYENALSLWDAKYSTLAATPENPYVASLCIFPERCFVLDTSIRHVCKETSRLHRLNRSHSTIWFSYSSRLGGALIG